MTRVPIPQKGNRKPSNSAPLPVVKPAIDPRLTVLTILEMKRRRETWEAISMATGLHIRQCRNLWEESIRQYLQVDLTRYIEEELDHSWQTSMKLMDLLPADPVNISRSLAEQAHVRMKLLGVGSGNTIIGQVNVNQNGANGSPSTIVADGDEEDYVQALYQAGELAQQSTGP